MNAIIPKSLKYASKIIKLQIEAMKPTMIFFAALLILILHLKLSTHNENPSPGLIHAVTLKRVSITIIVNDIVDLHWQYRC